MDTETIMADAKERVVRAGDARGLAVLIEQMKAHHANAPVQERFCLWLNNTALQGHMASMAAAGAVEAVVAALRAHTAHLAVQEGGLAVLANMAADTDVRAKLVRVGAVQLAVATARAHSAHTGVQRIAVLLIHNSTLDVDAHKALAGSVGAIEAVVAATQTHRSHEDIQQMGCWTLMDLCMDRGVPSNIHKAGKAGAVEAVIAALNSFPSNERLQDFGCLALAEMTRDEPSSQQKGDAAGGLDAVLAVMQRYRSNARVLGSAALALYAMDFNSRAETFRPGSAGAISPQKVAAAFECVLAALQKFPADARLQQFGAGALEMTFAFPARAPGALGAAQAAAAVSVLVAAIQAHSNDVELQFRCCEALRNIAAVHGAHDAMAATFTASAIKTVLASLQKHIGDLASRNGSRRHLATKLVPTALSALWYMQRDCAVNTLREVHAGALGVVSASLRASLPAEAQERAQLLQRQLEAAARAHAAQPCERCAGMRAHGAMCALPGCTIRKQPDGTPLQQCSRCMTAAYCCAAHQREAWPEHKKACRAMQRAAAAGGATTKNAS
jgi:hypothetical protein